MNRFQEHYYYKAMAIVLAMPNHGSMGIFRSKKRTGGVMSHTINSGWIFK